jgi:hypothetical protein
MATTAATTAVTMTDDRRSTRGFRKPPPTTWVYRKGVLRELKPAAKKKG